MKTGLLSIIILVLATISCTHHSNQGKFCTVNFELTNISDGTVLQLVNEKNTIVDSVTILLGKGRLTFNLDHPQRFSLNNKDSKHFQYKFLWFESSDITIVGDFKHFKNAVVVGSRSDTESHQFDRIDSTFTAQIDSLKNLLKVSPQLDQDLKEQIKVKQKANNESLAAFLQKHSTSYVTLSSLKWECFYERMSHQAINDIYSKLTPELQSSPDGLGIKKYLELPENPKVGAKYVDFKQTTSSGASVKLSDFEGKITLVEFWASGCGPCWEESPMLISLYNKYHPLGLEILGVSQDEEPKPWMAAIQKLKLPWVQCSDLKGLLSEPFLIYRVKGIPDNFIMDASGIIISKHLRGKELEGALAQLFGK